MTLRFLRNALVLSCLLILGAGGYFFAYPQLRAAWQWRQAQEAIAHGDFRAAEASLRSCLAVWPASGETHFLLARTARRAGDFDEARNHLSEAGRLEWPRDQIDLEEILVQAQSGDVPGAEPKLRVLLEHGQAEEPLILEALVRGCLQCNFAQDACRWSTLWTERHPEDGLARFWHARALEAGLQPGQAVEQYQAALKVNPDLGEARLRLAEQLLRSRRYAEAREQFHALLLADPEHPAALVGLADCQRAAGEIDAARGTLERLLAREPSARALSLRGILALDRSDPHQAVLFLRRADELDPYDLPTLKNLAAASHMLNDGAEALRYERRAEQLDKDLKRLERLIKDSLDHPTDAEMRTQAGILCLRLGRNDESMRWLCSALYLDRDQEPARKALGECLDKIGDPALCERYRPLLATHVLSGTAASP